MSTSSSLNSPGEPPMIGLRLEIEVKLVRTLEHHALLNAFLEATILTSVALRLSYLTVAVGDASIHTSVLNRAFEETLTSRNNQNHPRVTLPASRQNLLFSNGRASFCGKTRMRCLTKVYTTKKNRIYSVTRIYPIPNHVNCELMMSMHTLSSLSSIG